MTQHQSNSAHAGNQPDLCDDDDVKPIEFPGTPHQAYVAGWEAARRGDDLNTVVFDAAMHWPIEDIRLWSELVASASLGYWIAEGGAV